MMPAARRIINPTRLQQKDRGGEAFGLAAWGVPRFPSDSTLREALRASVLLVDRYDVDGGS